MRAIYAVIAGALMALAFTGVLLAGAGVRPGGDPGMVRPSDMGLRGALVAETMPAPHLTARWAFRAPPSDTARIAGALAGAGLFASFGIGPAYVVITAFMRSARS